MSLGDIFCLRGQYILELNSNIWGVSLSLIIMAKIQNKSNVLMFHFNRIIEFKQPKEKLLGLKLGSRA